KVLEPVRITGPYPLTIENHRTFTGLDDLEFLWSVAVDGVELETGRLEIPEVAPGKSAQLPLIPAATPTAARASASGLERVLTVRAVLAKDVAWTTAGEVVAW